jgi:hypothetical protein
VVNQTVLLVTELHMLVIQAMTELAAATHCGYRKLERKIVDILWDGFRNQ